MKNAIDRRKVAANQARFLKAFLAADNLPSYLSHAYHRLATDVISIKRSPRNYAYFGLLGSEFLRLLPADRLKQIESFTLFTLNSDVAAYDEARIATLLPEARFEAVALQEDMLGERDFCERFDFIALNNTLGLIRAPEEGLGQALTCLKPDGFFTAVTPGMHTLAELRNALFMVKSERSGGFVSFVPKFFEAGDLSGLVHRLGLRMGAVHSQVIRPRFSSVIELLRELAHWGLAGVTDTSGMLSPDELIALTAIYDTFFVESGAAGVTASIELLVFGGFAAAPGQLKRMVASAGLGDLRSFVKLDDEENNEKTIIESGKLFEEPIDD